MTVFTPTDRPKSVSNGCVIEDFGGAFVLSIGVLIFCWYTWGLLPGTCSHLWFAGVRECPSWFSIVGATVTAHQFFCILHFCHTCSLYREELVVQFPARGSTQVLLHVCIFPGVLWL